MCQRDMQTVGLREGDDVDRAYWKEATNNHSGDPRLREQPEEKKNRFCNDAIRVDAVGQLCVHDRGLMDRSTPVSVMRSCSASICTTLMTSMMLLSCRRSYL